MAFFTLYYKLCPIFCLFPLEDPRHLLHAAPTDLRTSTVLTKKITDGRRHSFRLTGERIIGNEPRNIRLRVENNLAKKIASASLIKFFESKLDSYLT